MEREQLGTLDPELPGDFRCRTSNVRQIHVLTLLGIHQSSRAVSQFTSLMDRPMHLDFATIKEAEDWIAANKIKYETKMMMHKLAEDQHANGPKEKKRPLPHNPLTPPAGGGNNPYTDPLPLPDTQRSTLRP
jgi:hypothetical protein